MQTNFTLAQLADAAMAESEKILRSCVHCGFCLATCPTYQILGDELDSPRGRIYQIKEMFENNRSAEPSVVRHLDRCLSCLACMTTCPSGVHYMHLVDHARVHVEKTHRRPFMDRWTRRMLGWVLPSPGRFRTALLATQIARPLLRRMPARLMPASLRPMLALAPARVPPPSPVDRPQVFPAEGSRRMRVALLNGCAQQVLDPGINEATVRLLTRHGVEVVVSRGAGCCGAVTHHMGKEEQAHASALANVRAWSAELAAQGGAGLDAVVVNTSGCGTTVKDYGFLLRSDPDWADRAHAIAAITRDITEVMQELGLAEPVIAPGIAVTYHSACSMQHGQKLTDPPKSVLRAAGFTVSDVPEGHLCCGSAGTYNILQPEIAGQLKTRKLANIAATGPQVVAAGNIGCMTQLKDGAPAPIVHTVELLDWATGGPMPAAFGGRVPDPAPRADGTRDTVLAQALARAGRAA